MLANTLLLIGFDTFFILQLFGFYFAPPFSFLALFFLPVTLPSLKLTPISLSILTFYMYAILQGFFLFIFDVILQNIPPIERFSEFIKQFLSLSTGVSAYCLFCSIFSLLSVSTVIRHLLKVTFVCYICFALFQVLSILLGITSLSNTLYFLRTLILGDKISPTLSRVSSLTIEPSSFAAFLTVIYIPSILYLILFQTSARFSVHYIFQIMLASLCVVFTFSVFGIASLLCLLSLFFFLINPRFFLFLFTLLSLTVLSIISIGDATPLSLFIPRDTYLYSSISGFLNGDLSWIAKFGSFIIPLKSIFTSFNFLGFGLGSTSFHISSAFSSDFIEILYSVSDKYVNLKSLLGRIVFEQGIIGLVLFFNIFRLLVLSTSSGSMSRLFSYMICVITIFTISTGSVGSFSLPLIWFWFAFFNVYYHPAHKN